MLVIFVAMFTCAIGKPLVLMPEEGISKASTSKLQLVQSKSKSKSKVSCDPIETEVTVNFETKSYGNEVTWNIDNTGDFGPFGNWTSQSKKVCLTDGKHSLRFMDDYGDGWHQGWIQVVGYTGKIYPEGYGGVAEFTVYSAPEFPSDEPPQTACQTCALDFQMSGGCYVLESGGDPSNFIPSGCYGCAEQTAVKCAEGQEYPSGVPVSDFTYCAPWCRTILLDATQPGGLNFIGWRAGKCNKACNTYECHWDKDNCGIWMP